MAQLNFHKTIITVPRVKLKILQKLICTYKLWQEFICHFPKGSRYALAIKIDFCFLEVIENTYSASREKINHKLKFVNLASIKLDLLKFLLQISWETKALNNKRYILLSQKLDEIGRMLGQWLENLRKLPAKDREKEDSF